MIAAFLFIIGVFGLLAMTWFFPVAARLFHTHSPDSVEPELKTDARRVAILIPAHNEERNLERTLRSINASVIESRKTSSNFEISICVGADGCTDSTAALARKCGANVVVFGAQQGKWKTISALVNVASDFDWVILADAGIIWPENFLTELLPLTQNLATMAIAPTYRAPGAGRLESFVWKVETYFKDLETALGGPVSIHGATIAYRRYELKQALEKLSSGKWLNDDVVLPLVLRALFPQLKIRYLAWLGVFDDFKKGNAQAAREFGRRRRMVHGNVQWIRGLLPTLFEQNTVAAVLSLRRAFRVLWAYWGLSLAVGAGALLSQFLLSSYAPLSTTDWVVTLGALGALTTIALSRFGKFGKVVDCAQASLLAPYYFFSSANHEGVVWK